MSDDQSVNFIADESLHLQPILLSSNPKHINNVFMTSHPNRSTTQNESINVLGVNRDSGKPIVNEKFEDYLTQDDANLDSVIVSLMGPKKIGKSFLLDSLLTADNGTVTRIMSKTSKPFINSPAHNCRNRNGDRIIFFDHEGEINNELFLWNYFLSSVMIYNLSPNNQHQVENLLNQISFVQSHLDSDIDDLSLPQLIVVRRDVASNKIINDKELLRTIEEYAVFQPQISVIHLPFPGLSDVKAKQIVDVPLREIDQKFSSQVEHLFQIIKASKSKIIKGNYLSSKILSLMLEPLTKSLNKNHRVSTTKVWDSVIQSLSIGFYNFYLKQYSNELQTQFSDEKPCDKYTIYKRLSKLKRRVDKKVEGFKNIEDDPIFMKYKAKLEQTIQNKQNLVKDVNKQKSRAANQKFCQKLLRELNENNCEALINEYCKSQLDDQKAEVLLENFQTIIRQRSKDMEVSKNPNKKSKNQGEELQKQLAQIQKQIQVASNPQNLSQYTKQIEQKKKQSKAKEQQLKQLEYQLQNMRNSSQLLAKNKDDEELNELMTECEKLKDQINDCDNKIENLRRDRQNKMKETVAKLEKQTKKQEDQLKKLEQKLKELQQIKPKAGKAQTQKKDTCCCVIM